MCKLKDLDVVELDERQLRETEGGIFLILLAADFIISNWDEIKAGWNAAANN